MFGSGISWPSMSGKDGNAGNEDAEGIVLRDDVVSLIGTIRPTRISPADGDASVLKESSFRGLMRFEWIVTSVARS